MLMEERKEKGLLWTDTQEALDKQAVARGLCYDFNHTRPEEKEKRGQLLKEIFGRVGKEVWIEPPLTAAFGKTVTIGDGTYINSNLTLVDDYDIAIGKGVLIGPNVTITATAHPLHYKLRPRGEMYSAKVTIEDNVWISSNVMICQGVTIGENSVIAAGSIVTRDIPANCIAAGNPCRVLREITDRDLEYYHRGIRVENLEGKPGEKKVIFIDVDGTLVDYEGNLPDSAVEAIQRARKNGHRVYISTGRSRAEVYQNIWDIGLDGMIGGNGSYVENHGTVVMHQLITKEQCKRVVDWLHSRGLEFYLESNNGLFASEHFEEKGEPVIQEYSKRKGKKEAEKLKVKDAFPDMIYGGELYREDLNKVSFILDSYQDYLDAKEAFPELKAGTWGGKGETALFGDLGVLGIDKGNAIRRLLEYIGADRADTIGIGDAKIDIPMLEYCALGVAMGSGGEEIKAVADYITAGVEEDGLWKAFEHLGLI